MCIRDRSLNIMNVWMKYEYKNDPYILKQSGIPFGPMCIWQYYCTWYSVPTLKTTPWQYYSNRHGLISYHSTRSSWNRRVLSYRQYGRSMTPPHMSWGLPTPTWEALYVPHPKIWRKRKIKRNTRMAYVWIPYLKVYTTKKKMLYVLRGIYNCCRPWMESQQHNGWLILILWLTHINT